MLNKLDTTRRFAGLATLRGYRSLTEGEVGFLDFAQRHTERMRWMQQHPKQWPTDPEDAADEHMIFNKIGSLLGLLKRRSEGQRAEVFGVCEPLKAKLEGNIYTGHFVRCPNN